jgi:hypothetical protein
MFEKLTALKEQVSFHSVSPEYSQCYNLRISFIRGNPIRIAFLQTASTSLIAWQSRVRVRRIGFAVQPEVIRPILPPHQHFIKRSAI